jgi:alkanesulfonate monooxygenase SsuD/methylene tetrahydromethanopterin reductase-like flavin-dependent oxidoreductase (luciferase family)
LSKIQFGVVVPQGWSYDFPLSDKDRRERDEFIAIKQYEYSKDIAEAIDKYSSIDSIYTYDHFLPYYAPKNETNFFDCFILLSAIAAITDRVKIGQVVTCSSYRNPALLAKMLSTLDIISKGRIELGIGAGWHKEEYRQYGYDFPPAPIRIEQLDEAITIVKSMWTEGRATFRGKHYSVNGAICNPKPVQKPHPVIMVEGEGERYLLKIAAKHTDRYNHPCGTIKTLKRKISILKEYCISIGRDHKDIEYSILATCLVRETEEELRDVMKRRKKQLHGIQQVRAAEYTSLIGTPEKIRTVINRYIDIGLTHFVLDLVGLDKDTINIVDSKIINKL